MSEYRVDLEVFRGPMDLLLYLVRRNEVDIRDIPIARITEQYLEYLELLRVIDVNLAGDFLVLASTLMEIKSRMLLPALEGDDADGEDPRSDLVRQLLEYKKFKDAASMLQERGLAWQERFARRTQPECDPVDPASQPIKEVELWDLVSAFSRLMRETLSTPADNIVYDETPIQVYMELIEGRLALHGKLTFGRLLDSPPDRARIVGLFLAMLELIARKRVCVVQQEGFGEILIQRAENGERRAQGGEPAAMTHAECRTTKE